VYLNSMRPKEVEGGDAPAPAAASEDVDMAE